MKKFNLFVLLLTTLTFNAQIIITNVVDGTCGADAKLLELYVNGTVDLTEYKVVRRSNNGAWTSGTDVSLSSLGTKTNQFVYLIRDLTVVNTEFPTLSVTASNSITSAEINHNGDDSYRIVKISDSSVMDQFGGDTDGSGTFWEYEDSWASRNNNSGPNSTFTQSEWTFHPVNILDTEGTCNAADPLGNTVTTLGNYSNSSLSIRETSHNEGFSVVPTVISDGKFYIQNEGKFKISSVEIVEMSGRVVAKEVKDFRVVDVSRLTPGMYLVKVNSDKNSIVQKIVIK